MPWRSYLKVCVIDGAKGARMQQYCIEAPDRDFIPSRLVTTEPPRTSTRMTALPPRRSPTNPPPPGITPVPTPPPATTIPMSPSTARLMARPKAGRSER